MMLDPFLVFEHRRVRLGAVQTATVPRSGRINAARSHAQAAQPASMARTRVDPTVAGWAAPSQLFLLLRFPAIFPFLPPSKPQSITNFSGTILVCYILPVVDILLVMETIQVCHLIPVVVLIWRD
ncbi:hypothetical protein [Gluconobacter cerinus]|uniref:hypothetical protein n=1 Tax=Gluconobacter cerinus TaxID=38307 RepID=UPI0024E041FD|nr:hypothetical protein [Gluconobacter cerinus]